MVVRPDVPVPRAQCRPIHHHTLVHHQILFILAGRQAFPGVLTNSYATKLENASEFLYTFLMHPGMDPTNNLAERTLRPGVIARKIRFGLRTSGGQKMFGKGGHDFNSGWGLSCYHISYTKVKKSYETLYQILSVADAILSVLGPRAEVTLPHMRACMRLAQSRRTTKCHIIEGEWEFSVQLGTHTLIKKEVIK